MEEKLYNGKGEPVAYILDDSVPTIYLWSGSPVAYLHEDVHIYGINGRHLGWFINGIIYNSRGDRVGFTFATSPVSVAQAPGKIKKQMRDELRPRWQAPSAPQFGFNLAGEDLSDFLAEGRIDRYRQETPKKESGD